MNLEEMKRRRRELGYSYAQLSELSGVPLGTIQKVFGGITASPRYKTLQALEAVLAPQDHPAPGTRKGTDPYATPRERMDTDFPDRAGVVREAGSVYGAGQKKQQGDYTLEDYYAWPEDQRIELIDGVIYDMPTPPVIHQAILGEILFQFGKFCDAREKSWYVIFRVGVQLDRDERTMLEPDLILFQSRALIRHGIIFGAPDLIMEVLSPETRTKDMTLKVAKYQNAGVQEYWIVDPKHRKILVYDFRQDIDVAFFTFDQEVPVRISDGECRVDFREVSRVIEGIPE